MLLLVVFVDCHPKGQPTIIIVTCGVIHSLALGQRIGGNLIHIGSPLDLSLMVDDCAWKVGVLFMYYAN